MNDWKNLLFSGIVILVLVFLFGCSREGQQERERVRQMEVRLIDISAFSDIKYESDFTYGGFYVYC
jgi:hypothetical protein